MRVFFFTLKDGDIGNIIPSTRGLHAAPLLSTSFDPLLRLTFDFMIDRTANCSKRIEILNLIDWRAHFATI